MSSIESLVAEEPRVGVFDHGANHSQAGAMLGTNLADERLNAFAQTQPAVVGAVIAGIGEEAGNLGADHHSQAQQLWEHPGIVDVGGRGHRAERQALGGDDDVIIGFAAPALLRS